MKNHLYNKGYALPAIIAIIVIILLAVIGYFALTNRTDTQVNISQPVTNTGTNTPATTTDTQSPPTLTQAQARALVLAAWGGCTPDTCSEVTVSTEQRNGQWYVTATYEGLRDDSVAAERKVALATFANGQWFLGVPTSTHRCQPNRGHQDFSAVLCI